jgi:hypothetical protein
MYDLASFRNAWLVVEPRIQSLLLYRAIRQHQSCKYARDELVKKRRSLPHVHEKVCNSVYRFEVTLFDSHISRGETSFESDENTASH